MQVILTQEEFNITRQTETNFNILYTTIENFRTNIKSKFNCDKNCESCLFDKTAFDGKTCLAGFVLPQFEEKNDNTETK